MNTWDDELFETVVPVVVGSDEGAMLVIEGVCYQVSASKATEIAEALLDMIE
jgi:hypothetical protein